MRLIIVLFTLVMGCSDNSLYKPGDPFYYRDSGALYVRTKGDTVYRVLCDMAYIDTGNEKYLCITNK